QRPLVGFWVDETTQREAIAWIRTHNGPHVGMGIYHHVNATSVGFSTKAKREHITRIEVAAQTDVDAKDGRSLQDAWASIAGLEFRPTFVAFTGGGFQACWRLNSLSVRHRRTSSVSKPSVRS